jgi:hypothetical protein
VVKVGDRRQGPYLPLRVEGILELWVFIEMETQVDTRGVGLPSSLGGPLESRAELELDIPQFEKSRKVNISLL